MSINATLGPMGYVATPSVASASQLSGVNPEAVLASSNFNFPSIIVYISAMPIVYPPSTSDLKTIKSADQETDRNPQWLDATFTLVPQGASGNDLSTSITPSGNSCYNGDVQVLGLLPQQTVSGAQNQVVTTAASAVNDVAGALASFYPGVQSQVSSATKALNVLFQDIFPPKPVAYQYSYMDGNCHFGWFFRADVSTTAGAVGQASLLGTQTGIILLQTKKNVKSIAVKGQTLSEWTKQAIEGSNLYLAPAMTLPGFILPTADQIDYNAIGNLSAFPMMIPKDQAEKILHFTFTASTTIKNIDDAWTSFAGANLKGNSDYSFVTNASLSSFLGLSNSGPPPVTSQAAAGK